MLVRGIVLAAGRSSRFGRPKALLTAGTATFADRILTTLEVAGIAEMVVVTRGGDQPLINEVRRHAPVARTVINPDPDGGQLSSLLIGLSAVDRDEIDAVLVTLIDIPLIRPDTVRSLLARLAVSPALVIRPAHNGRHGHPVIFRRALFDALRNADPAAGAKQVLQQFAASVEDVEVDDPGAIEDVDTVDDYVRLFGRQP